MQENKTKPGQPSKWVLVIRTKVAKLQELTENLRGYKNKVTGETVIETKNLGWFVRFEGSQEWLFAGTEKPDVSVGDEVSISINKVSVK